MIRCLVYIDLNMVRTGMVDHPRDWKYCGYNEIQDSKQRYTLINRRRLIDLIGLKDTRQLRRSHRKWIEETLEKGPNIRDPRWTESIAVGDESFIDETRKKLGIRR